MIWFLRIFGFSLLLTTVLPLHSTGKWYVRWWDFPRLQLAGLHFLAMIFAAWMTSKTINLSAARSETLLWMILLTLAFLWQVSHIIPFCPIWKKEVPDSVAERASIQLKLIIANLDYENNKTAQSVISDLEQEMADVLLLIEVDERWKRELTPLRIQFDYHLEYLRGEGLGIAVWSRYELHDSEVQYLISDRRASIWTRLVLGTGERVNFVGVHPTPPGLLDSTGDLRRDSRVRDAELILVAREIAARRHETWVVAGDFNDVAWSHTTRLFKRISGLRDPRIGRSFMGTFIAHYPLLRCPIDHVFLSESFAVEKLSRKRVTGSDHFAVSATVTLEGRKSGVTPRPVGDDRKDAKKIVEEGVEDARERGVDSPSAPKT